jgi:hypothetical protein
MNAHAPPYFMVFDVESVGLHGEGFQFGWVVVDRTGRAFDEGYAACPQEYARGDDEGRAWILANVPQPAQPRCMNPRAVRDRFWEDWQRWKADGAMLFADCCWPVEARFLAACVDDDPATRAWQGPYPLHDVASFRAAVGFDPLGTFDRLPDELPAHDPLADARQSARLLIEALHR